MSPEATVALTTGYMEAIFSNIWLDAFSVRGYYFVSAIRFELLCSIYSYSVDMYFLKIISVLQCSPVSLLFYLKDPWAGKSHSRTGLCWVRVHLALQFVSSASVSELQDVQVSRQRLWSLNWPELRCIVQGAFAPGHSLSILGAFGFGGEEIQEWILRNVA